MTQDGAEGSSSMEAASSGQRRRPDQAASSGQRRRPDQAASSGQRRRPDQAVVGAFASTRTAVVLISLIAAAAVVGTVLPDAAARKYVYGRVWFHILLGLLGLNLVVCMLWRKRVGMARIWSLLTHSGILLVLIGATVTLILAERGAMVIHEGQELRTFVPEGRHGDHGKPESLGFGVKLLDFRITHYPPVEYLHLMCKGAKPIRLRIRPGESLDIPGTEWRLSGIAFVPEGSDSFVEVAMPDGKIRSVPTKVGTTHKLDGDKLAIRILRYEPSFKIDLKTKEIASDTLRPMNPALQVALVHDGKEERPRWLFAKVPGFGHSGHGSKRPEKIKLRFLHPSFRLLAAVAETPTGTERHRLPLRLTQGKGVPSPWNPALTLVYARAPSRVKEYESEVEVLEEGRVLRRHVIRVNSPLVHKGTQLSQVSYDQRGLRWSRLGVSRDKGVWFVYAGFLAMTLGLTGKFYVSPLIRHARAGPKTKGG